MKHLLLLAGLAASALTAQIPDTAHLKNIRRLTNGGQNAEAYWAPDGKRIVFQSTRDAYKCDQIFLMNADGSDQRLISTGKGRTTCAYFLKDNKSIVYGSTHEGSPECPTPPDRSKGYLWAVFPTFDIFLTDDTGKAPRRITDANGYDAEATVNFKTGRVLYTSLASGDLELWQMNGDGSGKKQITNRTGYDGGAFFSHDAKKIVWRATAPDNEKVMARYKELIKENLTEPMRMELFIADANGKNVKQLTNFGCASFAPSFTPDDKHIIFASNKHNCDGRKFELFMINVDGSGLKQITEFGGFVSFPEFSPDGKKLVFSSDLGAKSRYEFDIFVADWVN